MNQLTGAEAMVRMLRLHGVEKIFGLCGDTSLPLYDALYRTGEGITHILSRDERHAAYMADCYARVTGKVGVCEGPSGGGATYILPGVVEANESSIPVLAITTDISVTGRGRYTLTELDQKALYRPLTKWNHVIDQSAEIPRTLRSAFRAMTTGKPGAAHIGLPFDVQRQPVEESDIWAESDLGRFPAWRAGPDSDAVGAAADVILSGKQALFVCGGGVVISNAEAELQALAEALEAPVATTISGQGSIAETHPLAVGVVGSNGGTTQTRAIVDAAVIGDAKLVLAALCEEIARRGHKGDAASGIRDRISALKKEKFDAFRALAEATDRPIKPERVVADLQAVLPEDAIIVADPGTPCPYFSAYYEQRRSGRHFISNRAHGALGFAMGGAIGAYFGRPDKKCVAVMGDGSFGMSAGEMETLVRLNLPITLVVISNSVFGWIKAGQKSGYDERYYSVDFSRTNHAKVAEGFGLKTWRVEDPADLRGALKAATNHGGPTLVDVICQPLQEARAPVSEWVA